MPYEAARKLTSLLNCRQWNRNSIADLDVLRQSCRTSSLASGCVHGAPDNAGALRLAALFKFFRPISCGIFHVQVFKLHTSTEHCVCRDGDCSTESSGTCHCHCSAVCTAVLCGPGRLPGCPGHAIWTVSERVRIGSQAATWQLPPWTQTAQ
jgi:hypothetical protein